MTDSPEVFDPYRKWLGIPPQDQPPHHYRLLGIEPLESDPDVIATAADGRMALIRNFQVGPRSAESQQILNQIAAAKVCLLNAEKKAEYDRKLRHRLEAEKKGIPNAAPPAVRKPKPGPQPKTGVEEEGPDIEPSSVVSYVARRGRKGRSWQIPVVIGVVAVMVVGLLVYLLRQADDATMAQQPGPQQERPEDTPPGKVPPPQSTDPGTPAPKPEIPQPETPDPEVPDPADVPTDPQETPGDQPTDPEVPDPGDDPGRSLADLIDPVAPNDPGNNPPTNPGSENPQPNGPESPQRLAVPDKEARQEAEKKIREIFGREFADARDPEKKAALAGKLFMQGQETTDDPVARFVLMRLACEMSADAGELTAPLDMVDQMQQLYNVDPLAIKAYLLDKVVGSMQPGSKTAATSQQVVDTAMQLIDEAVATDDFTAVGRFAKAAAAVARKSKDTALLRRVTTRNRELDRQKQRFTAAKKALEVLAEDPANAAANLTAGRYYCFDGGNWEKGLPMLAKGNDPVLLKLAKQDIAGPEDATTQVELADGWWDLAGKQPSLIKPAMQARAAYWYRRALPALAGLDKTRVEKRLEEIAAIEESAAPKTRGVVQQGNVALAAYGTSAVGVGQPVDHPEAIFDGQTIASDARNSYALAYRLPCQWIITLGRVYRLQEIRFKLWDRDGRFYRYSVATSPDGKTYAPLADHSQGQWSGWQQLRFPPRPVKSIKLVGLFNSKPPGFQVVEFEAYCLPPSPRPR